MACHLPDGEGGSNKLTGPLSIAFGCSTCHAVLDGRENVPFEDREFYMRRGMMRTMRRLVELEILKWLWMRKASSIYSPWRTRTHDRRQY